MAFTQLPAAKSFRCVQSLAAAVHAAAGRPAGGHGHHRIEQGMVVCGIQGFTRCTQMHAQHCRVCVPRDHARRHARTHARTHGRHTLRHSRQSPSSPAARGNVGRTRENPAKPPGIGHAAIATHGESKAKPRTSSSLPEPDYLISTWRTTRPCR